jgi:L-rhamnose mutarotase
MPDEHFEEGTAELVAKYKAADAKNLPMFKEKMTEILYSDETLAEFRKVAGEPVWNQWVADNKDKFDAQNVLDTMWALIEEARAKGL